MNYLCKSTISQTLLFAIFFYVGVKCVLIIFHSLDISLSVTKNRQRVAWELQFSAEYVTNLFIHNHNSNILMIFPIGYQNIIVKMQSIKINKPNHKSSISKIFHMQWWLFYSSRIICIYERILCNWKMF